MDHKRTPRGWVITHIYGLPEEVFSQLTLSAAGTAVRRFHGQSPAAYLSICSIKTAGDQFQVAPTREAFDQLGIVMWWCTSIRRALPRATREAVCASNPLAGKAAPAAAAASAFSSSRREELDVNEVLA